jgi:hypothetical protein
MATLSELLGEAAVLQRQVWKSYEPIFEALGYSEFPPDHVFDAVMKGVEHAAAALGDDQERVKLFRARKAIEEKRAKLVPEKDQCWSCGEPLGAPDDEGMRECPECLTKVDRDGVEAREPSRKSHRESVATSRR